MTITPTLSSADLLQPAESGSRAYAAPGRWLTGLMLLVAVALLFLLSGYALEFFGIRYNSSFGSIVSKIHPSTYLLALGLVVAVVANRDPVGYLAALLLRRLGSTALIVASVVLWLFISRHKVNESAAFLFDALIAAGLLSMLFLDVTADWRARIARMLHFVVALNCMIAIAEWATEWRLFPFTIGEFEQTWDYRATALFGHPLGGALATGVYAVILMTVRDVNGLAERWRIPMILLCMLTMPALGARTSFAIVYGVAGVMTVIGMVRFVFGGSRIRVAALLQTMLLVPAGIVAVAAAAYLGAFDAFVGRFADDSGSAETRLVLYELFKNFGFQELLVGYDKLQLETHVRMEGLSEGIENSWAGHLLRYGAVMSGLLWFGIAAWFVETLRSVGRGALLPVAFMLIVVSTSVGISGKTAMLTMPAALMLALVGTSGGQPARPPASPAFRQRRAA